MKVLALQGISSMYAMQAAHKLMLGLKMLPAYLQETYEEFYARLDAMNASDQESMVREAAVFVKLEDDEMLDILQFCSDPNGVPYTAENTLSLKPTEIHEIIVAVSLAVFKSHKIRLLSDAEKKN